MIFLSENDFKKLIFFVVYGNVYSYRFKYLDIKIKDIVLQKILNFILIVMCQLILDVFVIFEWIVYNFVVGIFFKLFINISSGVSCKKIKINMVFVNNVILCIIDVFCLYKI